MKIIKNANLKNLNSFHLNVYADYLVIIENERDLITFFEQAWWHGLELLVLGEGSNIVFHDNFKGVILKIDIKGKNYTFFENTIEARIKAGENWNSWVCETVNNGWYGLENLTLIPGTVGASVIQNIGAYGVEVKNVIKSVCYFDIQEKHFKTIKNEDCKFGYRESIFKNELKGKAVITEITFNLKKQGKLNLQYDELAQKIKVLGGNPNVKTVSDVVKQIRESKLPDPTVLGNAGSFFKNPLIDSKKFQEIKKDYPDIPFFKEENSNLIKIPAAWLIEKAGWKGYRIGNVGVYHKQALVLVNYGGASGKEIVQLAQTIANDIEKKFGIKLQTEVNIV